MQDENDIVYNTYGVDLLGFIRSIVDQFRGDGPSEISAGASSFFATLTFLWNIFSFIALALSLLFFIGFVYAKIRYAQLEEIEDEALAKEHEEWKRLYGQKSVGSSRWSEVQAHSESQNPNDWKLAIIEADIMLEETLENAGYVGTTIGEMLKGADPASFSTVQDAWDAHKIRNQIAHAGSDFVLTKRIAQEAIVKYERVFREFGAI